MGRVVTRTVRASRGSPQPSLTPVPFASLERPRRATRHAVQGNTGVRFLEPRIQYARTSDAIDIAYYELGAGEPLVVLAGGGGLSHLAREWQYPEQRSWIERLAVRHRVLRLDHRGMGLSDRDVPFDLELAALDIEAVALKERLQQFTLLGQLHTAAAAIVYAAQHPQQVSRLILWSPFSSYREFLSSSPALQAARAAADKHWTTYTELIASMATAWSDTAQSRRFAAYLRDCANEGQYVAAMERFGGFDASALLRRLQMPVLVLHRREAVFPSVELVSRLAAEFPAGHLSLLQGSAALPFLGDTDEVLTAIGEFASAPNGRRTPNRLTEREVEILALLAAGSSNKGIARALAISTRTVERHIGNIYSKIGAHNRAQATAYAFRQGIAADR